MSAGTTDAGPAVLSGLRVLEIGSSIAGEITGKVFAQLGGDVVKIEPSGGAASRAIGPFAAGVDDGEHSLHFWNYNVGKRSVLLDHGSDAGRDTLLQLLRCADVCVTSLEVADARALSLEAGRLTEIAEGVIVVSITPFGLTGPRAEWVSSDLVALAMGGFLNSCGYSDHSIPPIRPGGHQAYQQAASYAQSGAFLALLHRQRTGEGQLVDVAVHDTVALGTELANPYWMYSRAIVQRQTCRNAAPKPTQPTMFKCSDDRWVTFVFQVNNAKMWGAVLDWLRAMELELHLGDPEFLDARVRRERMAEIQGAFEVLFALQGADEATRAGQARGLPIDVITAPEELLDDEHLAERGFFVPMVDVDGGSMAFPRVPQQFSSYPTRPAVRAPRLGEHTDEVMREWTDVSRGRGIFWERERPAVNPDVMDPKRGAIAWRDNR